MTISLAPDDAPAFIEEVRTLVAGLLRTYAPPSLLVVKIDNFFGRRWLRFSGKLLGAVGMWKKDLTVPPFVPNRVVSQKAFVGPNYDEASFAKPIHIKAESKDALRRYVADVAPGALIVWYSGNSSGSGQGALMAYVPTADDYWPIYVRWENRDLWRVVEALEITAQEVERMGRSEHVLAAIETSVESQRV